MRTTFNIDDDLLGEVQRLTGMTERTAVIHELDVHVLASAALAAPARLWTLDRRLAMIARELDLASH